MLATDKFNGIIGVIKKILSTIGSPTWVQFRGEELRKMGKELTKVKAGGTKEEGEGYWRRFSVGQYERISFRALQVQICFHARTSLRFTNRGTAGIFFEECRRSKEIDEFL